MVVLFNNIVLHRFRRVTSTTKPGKCKILYKKSSLKKERDLFIDQPLLKKESDLNSKLGFTALCLW